jgi:CheY-like chemotaxis protein
MYFNEIRASSPTLLPGAVEVEIWEGYLLRSHTNIGKTLCTYSLDNGPLDETAYGTLIFRFTAFDWEKNIQDLLVRNNIHFAELRRMRIDSLDQLLRKKIYVAEDDPDILYTLAKMLEDAGYHVRAASSGVPILNGNYSWVDLFILDKQMPDIDGLDICRHLRRQSTTKETPVIMISAHRKTGNEAIEAGANDYIEKPFEMHYLLNVVSRFVKQSR